MPGAAGTVRGAPPGSIVKIGPYRWQGLPPAAGDCIVTEAGSAYEIMSVRGTIETGRYYLRCTKLSGPDDIDPDTRVLDLKWDKRAKRRRQR